MAKRTLTKKQIASDHLGSIAASQPASLPLLLLLFLTLPSKTLTQPPKPTNQPHSPSANPAQSTAFPVLSTMRRVPGCLSQTTVPRTATRTRLRKGLNTVYPCRPRPVAFLSHTTQRAEQTARRDRAWRGTTRCGTIREEWMGSGALGWAGVVAIQM